MIRPRFIAISLLCVLAAAQTASVHTPAASVSTDAEATKVVTAAQVQLKALSPAQKQKLSDALESQLNSVSLFNKSVTFNGLLSADPSKLTLREKNNLLSQIQRTQQLVDPSLHMSPASDGNADPIILAFQSSSPLTGTDLQKAKQALKALPSVAKSIGRLLWFDTADGSWTFEGTVFVIKPNVVATACHVVSNLTDVSGGQLVLRQGLAAVIDFSESDLPESGSLPSNLKTYPVVKLLGTGSSKGCDVAALQISGAEAIPPIPVALEASPPQRMLVVGYPQLRDLSPLVCQYAQDPTAKYFCQFRTSYPNAAKIASPGNLYTANSHDGISVITYSANTRTGQSGSPVLDLETLQVVGVHYCCTGSDEATYGLACALWHPQNLKWNEAIASGTLESDPSLKDYFGNK